MHYFTYAEAVAEHIELMRQLDEVRYGIFDRDLIESALARPQQAAAITTLISLHKPLRFVTD